MRQCARFFQRAPPRGGPVLIRYRVRVADLDRHYFEIECRIDAPAAEQRFSLPAWIPGSYLLRDFARHVVHVAARSGRDPLPVEKVDAATWAVRGAGRTLTLTITVYALDQSVRGAWLDRQRGYFNGPCVFLLPEGRDASRSRSRSSRRRTRFARTGASRRRCVRRPWTSVASATTTAADYDELLDHPVEISDFESVEFVACGVPHHLVIAGRFETDLERVAADLTQICATQIEFFGAPAPFEQYWFLGLAVGDGYGGLEHRASTSLIFGRDDLPKPGEAGQPRDYQRFLALASHEYFHTWHVKRSKPAAFIPYRLDRRNHTRLLWVFEGITSYYQELMLRRSGVLGTTAFLQRLGGAPDARLPNAGPIQAEPRGIELRRLGRAVPARAESPEHEHQLLHEGRARRARARSDVAARDGRPHVARRRDARALAPLRRARHRRCRRTASSGSPPRSAA